MFKTLMKPIKAIVILSAILSLTACSVFQPAPEKKAPLRIEFTDWWGDYTLIVAQKMGYFEKYGVEVESKYYPVFSKALPDLAAGQLDAGLFALGDALNVSRHAPLKVVTIYDNGGLNTIVSTSDINSVAEVKGKRIGVPLGNAYELVIAEMLRNASMSTGDVTLVNALPEEIPARVGVDLDAGFTYEPYLSEAIANGNTILYSSESVSGLFPDVIVFREQFTQERPEDVRAFLSAWFEAVEYRHNFPDEANKIIADYYGVAVKDILTNSDIQILSKTENLAMFSETNTLNLRPITATTELNGNFLIRIGTLTKLPLFDQFLDPSFLY